MNAKVIMYVFVGTAILLGGLIWLGKQTSQNGPANSGATASVLKNDEPLFDFGTISMANGKVKHDFKITNSSDQPVNIRKVYTSCMCTAANFMLNGKTYGPFGMEGMGGLTYANITMGPGDSGTLETVYDPNAHGPAGVGSIDRFVYVEDKNGGQLQFEIKTVVTP